MAPNTSYHSKIFSGTNPILPKPLPAQQLCPVAPVSYNVAMYWLFSFRTILSRPVYAGLLLLLAAPALAQYPPPTTEITAEHPLYVFATPIPAGPNGAPSAEPIIAAWDALDPGLKPYAALLLFSGARDAATQATLHEAILPDLQVAGVPVFLRLSAATRAERIDSNSLEQLLDAYTTVRGVELQGLRFDRYAPPGEDAPEVELQITWAAAIVESAARYGRMVQLPLEGLQAVRMMANTSSRPLLEKLRACAPYVAPILRYRGAQTIPATMACMGLWLEGTTGHWGVSPDPRWYQDAHLAEPGKFSLAGGPMPATLYRAMLLLGALGGARIYSFPAPSDLWTGPNRPVWDTVLAPTLTELADGAYIAREEFVRREATVAYQLNAALIPPDLLPALNDLDGVYGNGGLIHAVYGMDRPGQVPELIPNRSDRYWIPLLSPIAPPEIVAGFATVLRTGMATGPEGWDTLLPPPVAATTGTAYAVRVGRAIFVLNTREHVDDRQGFSLPSVPAPVRGITAMREEGKVVLTWPFREGDVSYSVWRHTPESARPVLLARGLTDRRYEDLAAPADATYLYGVTALTNESEPYAGTVGYGEYRLFSAVESRIAEEAVLTPVLATVQSTPLPEPVAEAAPAAPLWPDYTGLDASQRPLAEAIVAQMDRWGNALNAANLPGVTEIYAENYEDAQGWRREYVARAYQWLFERYHGVRLHRQLRSWDFATYAVNGEVSMSLYCRITAEAITDPSGRTAGVPVALPRNEAELRLTWSQQGDTWRLIRTAPALPNFRDLLLDAAGPYDGLGAGPDLYGAAAADTGAPLLDTGLPPSPEVTKLPAVALAPSVQPTAPVDALGGVKVEPPDAAAAAENPTAP